MRRLLFLAVLLILIPSFLWSQLPPVGYIALYTDVNRSSWCAEGAGIYPVEIWVWCLPSYNGQLGVEFGISYPANVALSTYEINSEVWGDQLPWVECEGNICSILILYYECQWDWHWLYHRTIYVTDSAPSYCEIVPGYWSGKLEFTICTPEYPIEVEPCKKLTNLYLNYDSSSPECQGVSAESKSWGSIKYLLR